MFRMCQLAIPFAAAVVVFAVDASAQAPGSSVADQIQVEEIQQRLRVQQEAELRRLVASRDAVTDAALQLALTERALAHHERTYRRNQRRSVPLLALGVSALAVGYASYAANGSSSGISAAQGALLFGGFGVTVAGARSWEVARVSRAELERWRSYQLAGQ